MQSACRDRRPQVVSTHLVCGQAAGLVLTLRGECGSSPIMSDMYCQNVFIVGPQRKESNGTERAPGVISEVSIKRTKISREQIASAPDPCLVSRPSFQSFAHRTSRVWTLSHLRDSKCRLN